MQVSKEIQDLFCRALVKLVCAPLMLECLAAWDQHALLLWEHTLEGACVLAKGGSFSKSENL